MAGQTGHELGQGSRVVREIGVHLQQHFGPALQAPAEARSVGIAEADPSSSSQHVHPSDVASSGSRDLRGTVGAPVVDHHHLEVGNRRTGPA